MNWGSTWELSDYAQVNWWNLYLDDGNPGGTNFEESKGTNPLLRVRPREEREVEAKVSTLTMTPLAVSALREKGELQYATESFDRQQPVSGTASDPRWLADRRELLVPVLDDRQVVAFQKILRDEEIEFLLLLIADESDQHGFMG